MANAKERCGKDASDEVKEIRDILNCDCNCSGQQVESYPIQIGGGLAVAFAPSCGITMGDPVTEGGITTNPISTKIINVVKGDTGDLAWSITSKVDGCNKNIELAWDYAMLANTILTTIRDQSSHALQDF